MTYEEAFEFLDRTAKGIAQMFGSSCETLVHDMSVPDHPILSIYNGHVSGREVGSTMDIMGVGQDLDEEARKTDFVNLYATTPAGQQIKSSTFHMMSGEYNLALGINFDYSSLVFANRILVDLMRAEEDLKSAIWRNGENRLGEILDECLAIVGRPVGALRWCPIGRYIHIMCILMQICCIVFIFTYNTRYALIRMKYKYFRCIQLYSRIYLQ